MKLLDNGLDSLKKAVKELKLIPEIEGTDDKDSTMKDIIIHLHHSIETLFKYLIQNEHSYLVFYDLEGAFNRRFDNLVSNKPIKDESTINFLDAVHRVFILLKGVNIDQQHYNFFEGLNYVRNALTHYEYEFNYNYEEHKIAGILHTLVPLYDMYIPNFKIFARDCGLYEDIKSLENKGLYWETERAFDIYIKINNAKQRITDLDKMPEEYSKLFNSKDKNIIYNRCPICKKELFIKKSNYIIDSENIYELGECICCQFEFTKEDTQFIAYKYRTINELLIKLDSKKLMHLVERQLVELGDCAYYCTVDQLSVIEKDFYNSLLRVTSNLCNIVAQQYVDRVITPYNDRAEHLYDLENFEDPDDYEANAIGEIDNSTYLACSDSDSPFDYCAAAFMDRDKKEVRHQWIDLVDEIKENGFPSNSEFYWRLLILMLGYITKIDNSISRRIKRKLSRENFLEFSDSMFKNWEGEDVDFEIPVTVKFICSKFKRLSFPSNDLCDLSDFLHS